jgi:hypothetical protein
VYTDTIVECCPVQDHAKEHRLPESLDGEPSAESL